MKMKPPSGPKKTNPKQTQSKPVLSAVEWANFRKAKMNLKSLAKKIWPHPQKRKAQEKSGFFLNSLIYWLGIC